MRLLGYSLLTTAIPHVLTAPRLPFLTDSTLYCSAEGLLARAPELLAETANHRLLDSEIQSHMLRPTVVLSSPIWGPRPDFCYCNTVAGLLMWGALSDERTGLSFGPSVSSAVACLQCRNLAMNFSSGSTISHFRRHVTVYFAIIDFLDIVHYPCGHLHHVKSGACHSLMHRSEVIYQDRKD
jgi:hypothetical protein